MKIEINFGIVYAGAVVCIACMLCNRNRFEKYLKRSSLSELKSVSFIDAAPMSERNLYMDFNFRCRGIVLKCCAIVFLCALVVYTAGQTEHAFDLANVSSSPIEPAGQTEGVFDPENNHTSLMRPGLVIDLRRQHKVVKKGTTIHYKSAYYGTLNLGTPSLPYTFVFDTGSGHLIVPSAYCTSETCKAHKRYKASKSSSARHINLNGDVVDARGSRDSLTVSFGTGEVTGVFAEEIVCVSEAGVSSLPAEIPSEQDSHGELSNPLRAGCSRMRIIAATKMSEHPFKAFESDGVLGLGLSALSQTPEFNFINMIAGVELPRIFGIFLGEEGETSQLAIGGWEPRHVEGDLSWNDVIHPEMGHWLVTINSIRVGDDILPFCENGCRGVVDTGTALLGVPSKVLPDLYWLLRHSPTLDGLCQGFGPQFHIELDKFTITLDPEDYSRPQWYKKKPAQAYLSREGSVEDKERRADMFCRPMMMSIDVDKPLGPKLFILGDPLLRKYYSVYDADRKKVGLGLANHNGLAQEKLGGEVGGEEDFAGEDDDSWFHAEEDDEGDN